MRDVAPTLRLMQEQDLDRADLLRQSAGWNQQIADWLRLIRYQPHGCFVAEHQERILGTVTTTSYGNKLAWIGMMLVDVEYRRKGIGTALMQRALAHLRIEAPVACIKLDATPAGRPVYERLGFQVEWDFFRWELPHPRPTEYGNVEPPPQGLEITPPAPTNAAVIQSYLDLDLRAFGQDRGEWLKQIVNAGTLITTTGGFGVLRTGSRADYLGPIIASTPETARQIISVLLAQSERPVFWDAPSPNEAAESLARQFAFQPVRTLTRMWLGQCDVQPDYGLQFGMVDPGTG